MKIRCAKHIMIRAALVFLSCIVFFSVFTFFAYGAVLSYITPGKYFIKNASFGNYMQIDDNDSPNFSTNGAFMELWGIREDNVQIWNIQSVGGGYYKIVSVKSGYALSVPSNALNKSGKALIQEPYTGATRQQWSFTQTARGTFVIRPRSGEAYTKDWCMSAGTALFGVTNGVNVEQKEYANDSNLKDEWYIYNTKLSCWHSDGNTVKFWPNDPRLYFENIDASFTPGFDFDNAMLHAKVQWQTELPITIIYSAESAATICAYGGTQTEILIKTGTINIQSGAMGKTETVYSYVASTYWGDSVKSIYSISKATTGVLIDTNYTTLRCTTTHELEHALGYTDHSTASNDIMTSYNTGIIYPTSRDINHLKQIYDVYQGGGF